MILYADASALVKRYVEEEFSAEALAVMGTGAVVATAVVSRAEVGAALARAARQGRLAPASARRAQRAFDSDWESLVRLPVGEPLVRRAAEMAWRHGLRGYDAVHLACAQLWQLTNAGERVTMATFDRPLAEAAQSAGLDVWPGASA